MSRNTLLRRGHRSAGGTARAVAAGALLAIAVGLASCGGSSTLSSATTSQTATAAAATTAATAAPAANAGNAANLRFTGSLAGSTTQAKASQSTSAKCGRFGTVNVAVTLNGKDYEAVLG